MWQIVERDDYGTDWHVVRYDAVALKRYDKEEDAITAAIGYLTSQNCDNVLTASEKRGALEAFMQMPDGIFLGILDGKDWYLTYHKDVVGIVDGERGVIHSKGDAITDPKYYELEGKAEVAVRVVPGT